MPKPSETSMAEIESRRVDAPRSFRLPVRRRWMPSLVGAVLVACIAGLSLPTLVSADGQVATTAAVAISTGGDNSCALLMGGYVDCWGDNTFGDLGDGTDSGPGTCPANNNDPCSATPVPVSGITNATQIAVGSGFSCARLAAGEVACWGLNDYAQLGAGGVGGCNFGRPCSTTPVQVAGITNAVQVAAGSGHACALLATGRIDCWGDNLYGELGDGTTTGPGVCSASQAPCDPYPVEVSGITNAVEVAVGDYDSCALLSTGSIDCWGANRQGGLGDGSMTGPQNCGGTPCSPTPVAVSGITNATQVAAGTWAEENVCAVLADGTIRCWGYNGYGELGNGDATGPEQCPGFVCSTTPVPVAGITGATQVSIGGFPNGYHACALVSGGQIDCWGASGYGELGNGSTTAPNDAADCFGGCIAAQVQVSGIAGATGIAAAGAYHSCALRPDGVYCWGDNSSGQLGNGSAGGISDVPLAVAGLPRAGDPPSRLPPPPVVPPPAPLIVPPAPLLSPPRYAALGDSYSSGEGVPPFIPGTDVAGGDQCHRSTEAYPELLRGTTGFPSALDFVACSGAKIANFYPGKGQRGETAGELSVLSSSDSLVSLTIGGNDVEFSLLIKTCVLLRSCELALDLPTRLLIHHTIGRLKSLYSAILMDAPNAQVYVLGYPDFFSPHPTLLCYGIDLVEARWITRMEGLLNTGIRRTIDSLGDRRLHYADTSSAFAGGELCSARKPVYMNGIVEKHLVYSFHPTARGQQQLADRLAATVRAS